MNDQRIARGMAAQKALRSARLQAGDSSLGWKIGFGTAAAMDKLGIQFPLVGFLSGAALMPSNTALPLEAFTRAAAEPEIAVHMGSDLGPDADEHTVRAAIAGLGPAIEVADLSFPPDDVERILAGNIYQRGVILGTMDASRAGARLDGLAARVFKDGAGLAQITDVEANIGRIVGLIRGLATCLSGLGLKLSAGEVVICGSIVPPVFIELPCAITYELESFDALAVRFTRGKAHQP